MLVLSPQIFQTKPPLGVYELKYLGAVRVEGATSVTAPMPSR